MKLIGGAKEVYQAHCQWGERKLCNLLARSVLCLHLWVMEVELSCVLCRHLLTDPLLLPCCCRAICSGCAKSPAHDNEDNDSDQVSVYSETDSGVFVIRNNGVACLRSQFLSSSSSQSSSSDNGGGNNSSISNLTNHILNSSSSKSSPVPNNTVKCPACRKTLLLGPDGLSGLVPYPAMSRIYFV